MSKAEAKTEPKNSVIASGNAGQLALPDYMQGLTHDNSTELLSQYVTPPRFKVLQKMSSPELLKLFDPGSLLLMPDQTLVRGMVMNDKGRPTDHGVPFHFVVLFFYPEFISWNPIGTKGQLTAIRDRSLDPTSALARKCQTASTWSEPCPEFPVDGEGKQQFVRHCQHLNFVISLLGEEQYCGVPTMLSFVRGEHFYGQKFAGVIRARKGPTIYSSQWEGRAGLRINPKGQSWHGIDAYNPSADSGVNPWVPDAKSYEAYRDVHEVLKKAHLNKTLVADYDDDLGSDEVVAAAAAQAQVNAPY